MKRAFADRRHSWGASGPPASSHRPYTPSPPAHMVFPLPKEISQLGSHDVMVDRLDEFEQGQSFHQMPIDHINLDIPDTRTPQDLILHNPDNRSGVQQPKIVIQADKSFMQSPLDPDLDRMLPIELEVAESVLCEAEVAEVVCPPATVSRPLKRVILEERPPNQIQSKVYLHL